MLKRVVAELEAYGLNVVSAARANLKKKKSNSSGTLTNSITYKIENKTGDNPSIDFYAEEYAKFVDKGVQGFNPALMPNGSLNRYNKAPSSPYKFGSGNFRGGSSLRGAIDRWVIQKGIPNVRDAKGRFIKRKTMVYLITRSIWNTGLRATNFFTDAQTKADKSISTKLAKAAAKDIEIKFSESIKKRKNGR
jgi:hypothetical protein